MAPELVLRALCTKLRS